MFQSKELSSRSIPIKLPISWTHSYGKVFVSVKAHIRPFYFEVMFMTRYDNGASLEKSSQGYIQHDILMKKIVEISKAPLRPPSITVV